MGLTNICIKSKKKLRERHLIKNLKFAAHLGEMGHDQIIEYPQKIILMMVCAYVVSNLNLYTILFYFLFAAFCFRLSWTGQGRPTGYPAARTPGQRASGGRAFRPWRAPS